MGVAFATADSDGGILDPASKLRAILKGLDQKPLIALRQGRHFLGVH